MCAQVDQLMQRCVTQLIKRMALDNFAEIAVLADKVKDQHLHNACVKFALQKENRSASCVRLFLCAAQFAHITFRTMHEVHCKAASAVLLWRYYEQSDIRVCPVCIQCSITIIIFAAFMQKALSCQGQVLPPCWVCHESDMSLPKQN